MKMRLRKAIAGLSWALCLGVGLFAVIAILRNRSEAMRLQGDLSLLLTADKPESLESSTPPEELEAINRLREEIDQLELVALNRAQVLEERLAGRALAPKPQGLSQGLDPDQWRNLGQASPNKAAEMALWAGALGDIEAMSQVLGYDEETAVAAQHLFDGLPKDLRSKYGDPRRVIALMTIDTVPLAHAKITGERAISPDHNIRYLQFESNAEAPKFLKIDLVQTDELWRLQVPRSAIFEYARKLGVNIPELASASEDAR